ncbi:MAG TPA: DinB family protein [Steroidobacteraceae bacterium]|nr:DinB family protein [Steroidobacteraceae bacterium]
MDLTAHCLTMHRYHQWAYGRLYESVRALTEGEYRRDVGLFFGSVHACLNHLLLVDRVWLGRLNGQPAPYTALDQEVEPDRATLEQAIHAQCDEWLAFLERVPAERFQTMQPYRSLAGQAFELPFASLVLHVPNHGTHHRGQISAALTQLGIEAPVMDLPYFLLDT